MNKLIINAGGKSGGRNNQGVITVFHRGGGNLKKCRIIDYKRCLFNTFAVIIKFEYGYRLNSKLALICYKNGMLAYIIAPLGLARGNLIYSSSSNLTEIAVGNAFALRGIPVGTIIHNIELKPGRGGQIMRSAGTYAKIIAEGKGEVIIKLCSGTIYSLSTQSMATVGIVSGNSPILNSTSHFRLWKAGESRWMNRRPVVRGVAMNPVDHPHGGGEGRSKGGRHPVSPWGKLTKGWKRWKNKPKIKRPQ